MPSKTVANHVHRYKKVELSRTRGKTYLVYQCTKPACFHYIPIKQSVGKLCECNKCGAIMIITSKVLIYSGGGPMAKPRCSNCIRGKHDADVAAIHNFITGTKVAPEFDEEE